MPDPPQTGLPLRADNLEYLRKQAKSLLRRVRDGDSSALARCAAVFGEAKPASLTLVQAQRVIARECGFASWAKLQDELRWREQARSKHKLGSATPLQNGETMNATQFLNLGAIDQIGLSCTNLEEAENFYCDVLGLRCTATAGETLKVFDCDGVNIIIFKGDSVPANSVIYFRVPPEAGLLQEKLNMLKSRGVKVESDAHVIARNWNGRDVWMAFFRDPFGNLLALKSDVPVK